MHCAAPSCILVFDCNDIRFTALIATPCPSTGPLGGGVCCVQLISSGDVVLDMQKNTIDLWSDGFFNERYTHI